MVATGKLNCSQDQWHPSTGWSLVLMLPLIVSKCTLFSAFLRYLKIMHTDQPIQNRAARSHSCGITPSNKNIFRCFMHRYPTPLKTWAPPQAKLK